MSYAGTLLKSFRQGDVAIETLTRKIGQKATEKVTLSEADAISINALQAANTDTSIDTSDDGQINLDDAETLSDLKRIVAAAQQSSSRRQSAADGANDLPMSPKVITRDVVATLENSRHLGLKLAAHAWSPGLFQAKFKAFVGDGSSWIRTIFDKHFRAFNFIAVLDIIHAVTYLYAAAIKEAIVTLRNPWGHNGDGNRNLRGEFSVTWSQFRSSIGKYFISR